MKQKWIALFLVVAVTAALLAGCGSGSSQASIGGSANNTADAGTTTSEETSGSDASESAGDNITVSQQMNLSMGTGGSSGTLYYIGAAIQQGVSENFSNLTVTAESTAGSVENLRRVNSGEIQVAMTLPDSIDAQLDAGMINTDNVCFLGDVYPNLTYVFGNTNLQTEFDDGIKGLRMGGGEPGSSMELQSQLALDAIGLTFDDMQMQMINISDQIQAIIDDRLDIALFSAGLPASNVEQAAAQVRGGGVHILNWPDAAMEKAMEQGPYNFAATIPANTYTGTDYEVQTPAHFIVMVCAADVPEDVIYELTKYIYSNSEYLGNIYPQCAHLTPENALQNYDVIHQTGMKLHPGAERYFKEIGILD